MIRTRSHSSLAAPPAPPFVALLVALLAALITAVLATAALPSPAAAHSGLVDSDPADGAMISQFDDEVVLTFSEEVQQPVTVIVTDPEGTGLQSGDPVLDGTEVRQALDPAVVSGLHTIAYRVISADGHPITGQVRVTVELDDAATSPGPSGATTTPSTDPSDTDDTTGESDTGEADEDSTPGPVFVLVLLALGAGAAFAWARRTKP